MPSTGKLSLVQAPQSPQQSQEPQQISMWILMDTQEPASANPPSMARPKAHVLGHQGISSRRT